jgi:hypothetical protein
VVPLVEANQGCCRGDCLARNKKAENVPFIELDGESMSIRARQPSATKSQQQNPRSLNMGRALSCCRLARKRHPLAFPDYFAGISLRHRNVCRVNPASRSG